MLQMLMDILFPNKIMGLFSVTVILAKFSPKINYYVKFFVLLFTAFFTMTISIPVIMFLKRSSRNASFASFCVINLARLLGITFEVRGKENVKLGSGSIMLKNHQSCLDMLTTIEILWAAKNFSPLLKKEIFYCLPFGIASYFCNGVFIDRKNHSAATKVISNEACKIRSGTKLLIFPEGTRHDGENLLPFKKGAFHLAIEAQCPIQPVVVSRFDFLDHKRKIFNRGHNIMHILPEIPTAGLGKENLDDLLKKVQDLMQAEYQKLNKENRINANVICNC